MGAAGLVIKLLTPASRCLCSASLSDIRYDAFDERPLPSADITAELADNDGECVPPSGHEMQPLITGRPNA